MLRRQNRKNLNKVVQNQTEEDNGGKRKKKNASSSSGSGFYYSFLTIILLLCLMQITMSAVLNISKVISYKAKIIKITKTRDAALARNELLKDSINNFSNISGLEAIARNNLKMSGEDEVLVIINAPKEEKESDKTTSIGLKIHD